jgi:hypothetical protein
VADPCGVYHDALMAIAVAPDSMYLATLRSHGMPKKPAEELESAVCDELPLLRDRVLAAFEEAYAPDDPTAETAAPDDPELAPAEGSASPKTSSSKKAPSKKSSSKKSSSKQSASKKSSSKKDPFEKVGKKLEKLFEG